MVQNMDLMKANKTNHEIITMYYIHHHEGKLFDIVFGSIPD